MKVPILKQGNILIATIQSILTDHDLRNLSDNLAKQVMIYRSRGVIIDVTELDVIDSFSTRTIRNIANMLKLHGAETIIAGIQPDVAIAMVQLGLNLKNVKTTRDLETGLVLMDRGG